MLWFIYRLKFTAWVIPVCNNIVGCYYILAFKTGFRATVYDEKTFCVETGTAYRFNIISNTFHIRRFGCTYFKTFSSFLPRKKGSINLLFMLLKDLQEFKRRYSY